MIKRKVLTLIILFNSLSGFFAQKKDVNSSVQCSYNQIYYFLSSNYKQSYNAGFNLLYSEKVNKSRFSIGFSYSSKRYVNDKMIQTFPLSNFKYSLPKYSVPISFTYFFLYKSKNQIGFNLGLCFDKSSFYGTTYFNETISYNKKYYFNSNIGISSNFGLAYRFELNKRLFLNINSIFSFTLFDELESEKNDKQSPLFNKSISIPSITFNVGLEYSFKKSYVSLFLNQNKPNLL